MSKYKTPTTLPDSFNHMIDPDGGFLCLSSHWRPDLDAANPEMPGHKLAMNSYLPLSPRDKCLCGSGKRYKVCCQPKKLWHPVCPNPDGQGYSLVQPQSATYRNLDGKVLRQKLTADSRLRCIDQSQVSSFWVYHGEPFIEDQYGILCFGDFELKRNHTLMVTAMSDLRMQILLEVLQEIAGSDLGEPRLSTDKVYVIDKATRKMRSVR